MNRTGPLSRSPSAAGHGCRPHRRPGLSAKEDKQRTNSMTHVHAHVASPANAWARDAHIHIVCAARGRGRGGRGSRPLSSVK